MATVAPPPPSTTVIAPFEDVPGDATWVISGVAAEVANRLRASVVFVRVVLGILAYVLFWPVIVAYAVAALVVPHSKSRRPGWHNLVGLARLGLVLIAARLVLPGLSFENTGLFGEGPAVWIAFCGALLAGFVALITSGRSVAGYDEIRCRRMVIASIPAAVLALAVGVGIFIAPEIRWELVLEVGVFALGAALAVAALRGARNHEIAPAAVLALLALLLAFSSARLQGGVGDTRARPATLTSVRHAYGRAIGNVTLDLSALRGSVGRVTSVDASIGIGDLTVYLPDNAVGTVDVRVGTGSLAAVSFGSGGDHSGFDLHRVVPVRPSPGNGPIPVRSRLHVRLTAEVGRGCVTILQVPGESFSNGTGCL
jgi:phage shock protein PspC (stress-responsive transcriptional regulator)